MIAALFVEKNGIYFNVPGVDPWDEARDARLYEGNAPAVAHPPCERWGRFANGSPLKKGYTPGADEGKFKSALGNVNRCGGVLEHPKDSKAWDAFNLVKPPREGGWVPSGIGWCCQVEQGHYGHKARKATWLYFVGNRKPPELRWGKCEQRLPAKRLAERGYASARRCGIIANMCSAHRQRTPMEFRDLLISLAHLALPLSAAEVK